MSKEKKIAMAVGGRLCHVFGRDGADTLIICGMENHTPDEISDTAELFYKTDGAENTRFIIFETKDWNGDFSPWPSEAVFGDKPFLQIPGNGLLKGCCGSGIIPEK